MRDALDLLPDLKVVEVSSGLRGAFAGHSLVRLGATVTRWDRGEVRRDVPALCDEGKQTIAYPAGIEQARELLHGVHAVIDDTLSPELVDLIAIAPDVVHIQVTGLGATETAPNPPGSFTDAASGIMWDLGREGASPLPLPAGAGSTMAGIHAATAALWTALQRFRGGDAPRVVDIAEADVVTAQTGTYHLFLRAYGGSWHPEQRPARGSLGSSLGLGALLDCLDGPALVYVSVPSQLARLHAMMPSGFAERYPTYRDGLRNRSEFVRELREWAAPQTRREILDTAELHGVVCSPFLDMNELDVDGTLPLLRASADEQPQLPSPWMVRSAEEVVGDVSRA